MSDRLGFDDVSFTEQERLRIRRVQLRLRAINFAHRFLIYHYNDENYQISIRQWEHIVENIEDTILFEIEPDLRGVPTRDLWYCLPNQTFPR